MTPTRTKFQEADPRESFQLEMEPTVIHGTSVEVLSPEGTIKLPPGKTSQEIFPSKNAWRAVGRFLKQSFNTGASILSGTLAFTMDALSSLPWREVWHLGVKWFKLGVCVFLDILDCFVGRLLGFGILFDLGCALISAALWGKRGWWCLLEILDITEQIDGFIPTCTIIALRAWNDD